MKRMWLSLLAAGLACLLDLRHGNIGRTHLGFLLAALLALFLSPSPAGAQAPERSGPELKRLPALTPVVEDGLTEALAAGEIDAARYALERATALFHPVDVRARYGADVARPGPRQATMVLRDLVGRLDELSPAERARAKRLLARPTEGAADPDGHGYTVPEAGPVCSGADFCLHYVPTSVDAPPALDDNGNGLPDWVETSASVLAHVWGRVTGLLGYRRPLSDTTSPENGGDGRLDVYLANLGDDGLFGYCTSDDPDSDDPTLAVSAYCVLDNDYLEDVFKAHTPLANLRVTAAHEFFHAVQAGYDYWEDLWITEATATWIEDEVYDAINDNRQYLATSPLRRPGVALDIGRGFHQYGAWIYFRFLSERFGRDIVRTIWNRARVVEQGGPDHYSLQAVASALSLRGRDYRAVMNAFVRANRTLRRSYSEGAAYPPQPTRSSFALRGGSRTRAGGFPLAQLATQTVAFRPGSGIGRRAQLALTLNLPPRARGSEAAVLVFARSGAVRSVRRVGLDGAGNAILRAGFGRGRIGRVELVLSNASRRYECWVLNGPWTCSGLPLDEGLHFSFRARAIG
jgi:hypothetical protein